MNEKVRVPLVHISRRSSLPWYKAWAIRASAIVLALIVCGVITALLTGENPISIYASMLDGAFGTSRRIWVLLQNIALVHVPPSIGSLLLSLESPSGVLFSVIFANELLSGRLLAGFALIFVSIVLSETHFSFLRPLLQRR